MRKTKPKKRILLPDPRYHDPYVTRFVNNMMLNGKKSKAYDIFYAAMDLVEQRTKDDEKSALEIFKTALDNITPQVEVSPIPRANRIFERYERERSIPEVRALSILD